MGKGNRPGLIQHSHPYALNLLVKELGKVSGHLQVSRITCSMTQTFAFFQHVEPLQNQLLARKVGDLEETRYPFSNAGIRSYISARKREQGRFSSLMWRSKVSELVSRQSGQKLFEVGQCRKELDSFPKSWSHALLPVGLWYICDALQVININSTLK